jgi:hypothetical protein
MRLIDMSAEAVTARLKLASELRRLCLKLGAAKISPRENANSGAAREIRKPHK